MLTQVYCLCWGWHSHKNTIRSSWLGHTAVKYGKTASVYLGVQLQVISDKLYLMYRVALLIY